MAVENRPDRLKNLTSTYGQITNRNLFFASDCSVGEKAQSCFLYEKDNHLGNVMVTASDRKLAVDLVNNSTGTGPADGLVDYYTPDVIGYSDFYSFGMVQPGRNYVSANGYRYGFNGKEKVDELHGNTGDDYDYGMRNYDARVCRFASVDPLTKKYPELTPYQFASNTPIQAIDLDGLEKAKSITPRETVKPKLKNSGENPNNPPSSNYNSFFIPQYGTSYTPPSPPSNKNTPPTTSNSSYEVTVSDPEPTASTTQPGPPTENLFVSLWYWDPQGGITLTSKNATGYNKSGVNGPEGNYTDITLFQASKGFKTGLPTGGIETFSKGIDKFVKAVRTEEQINNEKEAIKSHRNQEPDAVCHQCGWKGTASDTVEHNKQSGGYYDLIDKEK